MTKMSLTPRQMLIVAHDLLATAAAIIMSFYIRFEAIGLESRLDKLIPIVPGFVIYAGFIYYAFGLLKTAVVLQQIYYRWRKGNTTDARFAQLIFGVRILSELARTALNRGTI